MCLSAIFGVQYIAIYCHLSLNSLPICQWYITDQPDQPARQWFRARQQPSAKFRPKDCFVFFLSGHTTINLVLQMKKICVKFGQEVGQRGRRIVCEVFVSSCKFGCTVAPVWVHAPPCKGRRQYFSDSRRKKRTSPHSLIELGQTIFLWQKPVKVFPLLSQDQLFVITDNTSAVLGILQPKKDQGQERRASGTVHGSPHSIGHITSRQCAWQTSNNHGRHAG